MNVPRTRRSPFSDDPVSPREGRHQPVLLHEVVAWLDIQPDDIVVDATLGGAGHAKALVSSLGPAGRFIGFDLDGDAIERARLALKGAPSTVDLVEANFRSIAQELDARSIPTITKALFDLGWSSYQLDSGRGFSLQADEPLSMTYTKRSDAVTAALAVNTWGESTLADIIYGFGEERYSRRIANAIVQHRERTPFKTAKELADVIAQAVPGSYRHGRIHPATKSFQALRIAVNDELGALQQGISAAFDRLAVGGRIAVITFHSIEDRAVKHLFAKLETEGKGVRCTKKPIVPSSEELSTNRRARSAKLRVFEKTHSYDKENTQDEQIQNLGPTG